MANFYDDNADLRFYIERAIEWERLVRLTEYDGRAPDAFKTTKEAVDTYVDVLKLIGNFSAEAVAPHWRELDTQPMKLESGEVTFPPRLQGIFDQIRELGLHGLCIPRELDGLNTPFIVFMIANELMARADVSVCAHNGFHGGMAMAMLLFSIIEDSTEFDREAGRIRKTRFEEAIRDILSGAAWGSMDITEPHAGSDMAQLRTVGEQDDQGNWFVTGQKIFITSGHAKYHFVIARTEKPAAADDAFAGLQGLSMFLVPIYADGPDGKRTRLAEVVGIEEKMGHHASATCSIAFDRTPAHLIGKRGDGFRLMLQIMNNARIGVGFEAIGLCEAAYRKAVAYAEERPSMGKPIVRHEMIADYLDEMRTDLQAMRALAVTACYHEEMAQKIQLGLRFMPPADAAELAEWERELARHRAVARRFTPLLKYLAAEKAVEMARRCIQIHGGMGYIQETGAEKLMRDAMVFPIYEGTSQIQALMAMKDTLMGVMKDPGGFVRASLEAEWKARAAASPLERRVAKLQSKAHGVVRFLMSRMAGRKFSDLKGSPMRGWAASFKSWDPKRDFALAMLHAERLARILTDVAVCELLLEQSRRFPERAEVLERYIERAEPRCRFLVEEITTTGARLLASLRGSESADEGVARA